MTTRLAHQTQKAAGIGNGLRTATVSAVSTAGITLSINGTNVGPFACIDTMLPVVGDVVSVFRQDSTWIILGRPTLNPTPWFFPTLLNGWTGKFGVRLVRGAGLSMQVAAQLTAGTKVDGTSIAVMASPYLPQSSWDITSSSTTLGTQSPHFNFNPVTGSVACFGLGTSATGSMQALLPMDL